MKKIFFQSNCPSSVTEGVDTYANVLLLASFLEKYILVGNKLQVQFISKVLVVMKDHQMVQPCLGHCAPKIGFDAKKGTK